MYLLSIWPWKRKFCNKIIFHTQSSSCSVFLFTPLLNIKYNKFLSCSINKSSVGVEKKKKKIWYFVHLKKYSQTPIWRTLKRPIFTFAITRCLLYPFRNLNRNHWQSLNTVDSGRLCMLEKLRKNVKKSLTLLYNATFEEKY